MKPVRLPPSFREKVWGKADLAPWFADQGRQIGEVWFEADPPLPILVKFLFTTEKLSVQVHPPDTAKCLGKTEMWYILDAAGGQDLALGFREPVSKAQLREAAVQGNVEGLLRWHALHPHDVFFAPPGTVHAIGAGVTLCEIQENADITYRLYDYGRPRELHVDQALAVADLGPHPGAVRPFDSGDGRHLLVECDYFVTESLRLSKDLPYAPESDRFHLLICLEGQGMIGGAAFLPGEVWLVPANAEPFAIQPEAPAHFLRTYPPKR